jgi:FtsP/CotA-like multicopper oxidase with cupredoxin domain
MYFSSQNGHSWHEKFQQSRGRLPYLVSLYVTNSTTNYTLALENDGFDPTSHTFPALPGEVLDIVWENESGVTGGWDYHPMHVHGEHVYDLGSGNGTYDAALNEKRFADGSFVPARRDSTNLYRYAEKGVPFTTAGWRAWRIRVTEENIGAWMMHCHVAQHAVMGMNTVWVFGERDDLVNKFPQLPYVSGYLEYGGDAYGNETRPPTVEHWFGG